MLYSTCMQLVIALLLVVIVVQLGWIRVRLDQLVDESKRRHSTKSPSL